MVRHVLLACALAFGAMACVDDAPDCGSGPRTDVVATSVIDVDPASSYANFVQDGEYQGQMTLSGTVHLDGPPCAVFPCDIELRSVALRGPLCDEAGVTMGERELFSTNVARGTMEEAEPGWGGAVLASGVLRAALRDAAGAHACLDEYDNLLPLQLDLDASGGYSSWFVLVDAHGGEISVHIEGQRRP